MRHAEVTEAVIGRAFDVHHELGSGFLETVYEAALALALADAGMHVVRQAAVDVRFRGRVVGEYRADLLVEQKVIVEVKAGSGLLAIHEAQLLNYLKATGVEVGLLINFGKSVEHRRRALTLLAKALDPVNPSNPRPTGP